jgi:KDO2-lipid IV(A) lauroyltransferase
MTRPWRHALMAWCLEGARRAATRLSHRGALRVGRVAGDVAWLVAGAYRRQAMTNLRQAGIGRGDAERRALTRRVFRGLGMSILESLHATGWSDEQFKDRVALEGTEAVWDALRAGRGLLFANCHMGAWELTPRAFSLHFGHPATMLMASLRDQRLNERIVRMRRIGGNEVILTDRGMLPIVRLLRRGGMLGVLADQDTTRARGVFVEFFGRPARVPIGPARLALGAGVAIVPTAIHRRDDDPTRHVMTFGEAIRPDPNAPIQAEVERLTAAFTLAIEKRIRAYPHEWAWIHDRWRHRPDAMGDAEDARRRPSRAPHSSLATLDDVGHNERKSA